jgi:hypothetical protein
MTMPIGAADGGDNGGQGENSGINPAWNDVLSAVPEDVHSQITPHLRNWDQNFQRVQSDFAPYKEFKEANISPDQIRMGMGIMQALEQNPKQVYDLLQQQFNFGSEGDQGETENAPTDDLDNLPDAVKERLGLIPELQKQLETVMQWAVGQQSASTEAQEDEALDNLITGLKSQHGDFDERYVLSLMQAGVDPQDAIAEYNKFVEKVSMDAQRPKAPKILGSGGIVPGEQPLDPRKMTSQDTKSLVAQMLAQSAAQNR